MQTPKLNLQLAADLFLRIVAVWAAFWALIRWLIWPRMQKVIRDEVTGLVAGAIAEAQTSASSKIDKLTESIERLERTLRDVAHDVSQQGRDLSGAKEAVNIILQDRRIGLPDLRPVREERRHPQDEEAR